MQQAAVNSATDLSHQQCQNRKTTVLSSCGDDCSHCLTIGIGCDVGGTGRWSMTTITMQPHGRAAPAVIA